jgi:hypothetical protein
VVLSVSPCVERPEGGCVVTIHHSDVQGAEQYEVQGPGDWDAQCIPGLNLCHLTFEKVPEVNCDFTLQARAGSLVGPPSEPFCVPGTDPERARS